MMSKVWFRRWLAVIAILAIGLRIGLALVNTSANDNHLRLIEIIFNEGRLPTTSDDSEGFQPKLFYVTAAAVLRVLPIDRPEIQLRVIQMINVIAGILTLLIVFHFLRRGRFSPRVTLMVFALAALNPKFIGINAQATNDSFVILFSALAMNAAVIFFRHHRSLDLMWLCLFSIFAAISKGNGLVLVPLVVLAFAVDLMLFRGGERDVTTSRIVACLAVFILSFLTVVPIAGQYVQRYRDHGTPFVINISPSPLPALVTKTEEKRPGVRSVLDAFGTFRLFDLLRSPVITTQRPESYPEHRTSLWTQLYGRAHFVHFDQWPPAWKNQHPGIFALGRTIFVLALVPTALCIMGFFLTGSSMVQSIRERRVEALDQWIVVVGALGWIAFVMLYSLRYRDFSVMKFIFILPAIASAVVFLGTGMETVLNGSHHQRWARFLPPVVTVLSILYCVDIGWLIFQLA